MRSSPALQRSALARVIFTLVDNAETRTAFRRDPAEGERVALAALDREALRERFRVNPMLLSARAARLSRRVG